MRTKPRLSPRPRLVVKAALILACALVAFYGYGCQRTASGPLERSTVDKARYVLKVGVRIGLFTVFFTPVLPLYVWREIERPRRRLSRGLCPTCEYPLIARHTPCPECGQVADELDQRAWRFIGRMASRVATLLLLGVLLGSAVAETWILLDEQAFIAESKAAGPSYWRLRRGAFYGEMFREPGGEYWVVDD